MHRMKQTHIGLALLGTLTLTGSALALTLSDTPLFITGSVAPNLVLTLDDSGSMRRGFVPEHCNDASDCAALDNRWAKSSHANALYYNPNVYYPAPLNADRSRRSTAFGAAWRNGFYTSGMVDGVVYGSPINLATGYRPTAGLQMNGTFPCYVAGDTSKSAASECHMEHYSSDLAAIGAASVTAPAKAYYYDYDASLAGCKGSKTDNACYRPVVVSATSGPGTRDLNGDGVINAQDKDERQNFANWYSFYRTRNLAVISAASLAFSELDPSVRVAWQALNTCRESATSLVTSSCQGWSGGNVRNAIREFGSAVHRQNFYDWLFKLPMKGDTQLREAMRRAGEYFSQTDGADSPYNNAPGDASSGQYSCRRNFHILMTDGIWNDRLTDIGNVDDTPVAGLPDANRTPYEPGRAYARVYRDSTGDTLADLAFRYWKTDLAPSLANKLPPITDAQDSYNALGLNGQGDGSKDTAEQIFWNARNDPATWQHMNNFTIGLGLTDYLSSAGLNWAGDMYAGSFLDLASGTTSWPRADETMGSGTLTDGSVNPDYGKSAHDLWHAAVNSRGRFFSADTPETINDAFAATLRYIRSQTSTAAALAASSTQAETETQIFKAQFDTTKWNGQLYAYQFDKAQGTLSPVQWSAAAAMPAHGSRNIFIRSAGTGNTTVGASFAWGNLTPAQQAALSQGDDKGALRLNWLRGDHSQELRFAGGIFRDREVKAFEKARSTDPGAWELGDIISSEPRYVGADSEGYDNLPARQGGASYGAFLNFKKARTPVIYVGANDGMLHAFAAPANTGQSDAGKELFAVIPTGVFDKLHELTRPGYVHRYFVDGSPNSGDAYLNNGLSHASGWNTVVASGLRAGGKSVFALDATLAGSVRPEQFMWEYTDADMGYSYSQPQIGRLNDGSWVAVFGNGYQTSNGGSILYVVDLRTGSLIRKIPASAAATGTDNGLSTPALVDTNGDGIKDYAYAGDLQGNLWKFDLSASSSSGWGVANGGSPLFVARDESGNRQSITVQPTVAREAAKGGHWVLFGTGRYLSGEDLGNTAMAQRQSFYGLWDSGSPISARSQLVAQTIDMKTALNGHEVRVTSDNAVDLGTRRGWYMDLQAGGSGERVVAPAVAVFDNVDPARNRIIFVTTLPSTDPCSGGGTSWLMELHFNGRRPWTPVFDLDDNGQFDTLPGDTRTISGVRARDGFGIMAAPVWIDKDTEFGYKLSPGTEKSDIAVIRNKGRGKAGTTRRVSWQQLM